MLASNHSSFSLLLSTVSLSNIILLCSYRCLKTTHGVFTCKPGQWPWFLWFVKMRIIWLIDMCLELDKDCKYLDAVLAKCKVLIECISTLSLCKMNWLVWILWARTQYSVSGGVSLFLWPTCSLNKRCYIHPSRRSFYLLCSLNLSSVSNFILGFWQDCTIKTEPALFFFSFSFSSTKLELFISWCLYFFFWFALQLWLYHQ